MKKRRVKPQYETFEICRNFTDDHVIKTSELLNGVYSKVYDFQVDIDELVNEGLYDKMVIYEEYKVSKLKFIINFGIASHPAAVPMIRYNNPANDVTQYWPYMDSFHCPARTEVIFAILNTNAVTTPLTQEMLTHPRSKIIYSPKRVITWTLQPKIYRKQYQARNQSPGHTFTQYRKAGWMPTDSVKEDFMRTTFENQAHFLVYMTKVVNEQSYQMDMRVCYTITCRKMKYMPVPTPQANVHPAVARALYAKRLELLSRPVEGADHAN